MSRTEAPSSTRRLSFSFSSILPVYRRWPVPTVSSFKHRGRSAAIYPAATCRRNGRHGWRRIAWHAFPPSVRSTRSRSSAATVLARRRGRRTSAAVARGRISFSSWEVALLLVSVSVSVSRLAFLASRLASLSHVSRLSGHLCLFVFYSFTSRVTSIPTCTPSLRIA